METENDDTHYGLTEEGQRSQIRIYLFGLLVLALIIVAFCYGSYTGSSQYYEAFLKGESASQTLRDSLKTMDEKAIRAKRKYDKLKDAYLNKKDENELVYELEAFYKRIEKTHEVPMNKQIIYPSTPEMESRTKVRESAAKIFINDIEK